MNPIFAAALEIQKVCDARKFPFCFIGGVAVQRWGEPRLTADVDLTLLTGFGAEAPYIDALLTEFRGRLPDTREFALVNRTLLLWSSARVALDVSLGAMPFEEHTIERASDFTIGAAQVIRTCSAEDLIVHKTFAGRDKDWLDIRGIVKRRGDALNRELIWTELAPLLELAGDDGQSQRLRAILS
ncbi:MAG: nucleotidyl transferase AbiEii/AbiGii toxin family protein [Polyangiaceae bacterium]|nr:nucleotidyl transferase AbiEii/AbiGii toxin family protein [Polyangiaceae bacterium]